jgi:ketosteroid isomerase-like protein
MYKNTFKTLSFLLIGLSMLPVSTNAQSNSDSKKEYVPDDLELYQEIVNMDTEFFNAYNSCDLKKQNAIYAEDIEFFHDQGGLMTSKQGILDATEKNICGKVTRRLVPGSIEVYPIKDFGAIEFGEHTFKNNQENADTPSQVGKFVIFWEKKDGNWKITKVVSLH